MEPSLKAGGVEVSSPIWLAPMAGISTRAFRWWHAQMGAGLMHTEMVSALGLLYGSAKTAKLLGDDGEPGPTVIQLFAPDADSLRAGAEIALKHRRPDAIEINMACPMPKVTRHGSGSAMLARPEEAARSVRLLCDLGLPVWVKIRKMDHLSAMSTEDVCARLIDAGARLLIVHGRTPSQRYDGCADREIVRSLARRYPTMIAASGDVYTPEDAVDYLDGGCSAVLAARGALADAYLIARTNALLGLPHPEVSPKKSIACGARALKAIGAMAAAYEGDRFASVLVKKMMSGFWRAVPGSTAARRRCAAMDAWAEIEVFLSELANDAAVL